MSRTYIALSLMLLAPLLGLGQRQGDVWFFGDRIFLDFSSGSPVLYTNTSMTTIEGSSALAEKNGSLRFYTTGKYLHDRSHQTVQNWPLVFEYSGSEQMVQGTLLLEINDSLTFLFSRGVGGTVGHGTRAYFASIDNNGNSGLGAVTSSHIVFGDSLTEHFAAIRDASLQGWWIISHITQSDRFVKFHISSDGTFSKSYQTIGGVHPPLWEWYISQLVFNEQGDRMVITSDIGFLEYYAFDRCTGNLTLLNTLQKPPSDTTGYFGLSFSPSGKLLYASDGVFGPPGQMNGLETKLYQYELDSTNILATQRLIWTTLDCDSCRRSIGHHKLAPDGKIYMPQSIDDLHYEVQDTLMAINFPDSIGLACGFDPHALVVKPAKTRYGLPNIPNYRIRPLVAQVAACGPNILLCKNDSVRLGVPDTSGTLTFQWWPTTGLSDPTAAQPWASPSTSTTYHLMVVDTTVHSSCDNTIDSVRVTIVSPLLPRPVAFAGRDTTICAGQSLQLGIADTAGGAWDYAWTPSAGIDDSLQTNPTATPIASTQYILTAYRPEVTGNCQTDRDTVAVTVYDPSLLPQNPAGPDIVICNGDTIQLGVAGGSFEYDWSTTVGGLSDLHVAQPLAWPTTNMFATVSMTDTVVVGACGVVNDTVSIVVEQPFPQDPPADVSFCVGECFTIGVPAVSGYQYLWSPVTGLETPNQSLTKAQPTATTIYNLNIINPALQSAHCREKQFTVLAIADACNHQSFIAVNGDAIADRLNLGDHAGLVSLRVHDVAGRLVFASDDYQNDWSAAGLAHGMYVYRVTVEGDCASSFTGKIVVVH